MYQLSMNDMLYMNKLKNDPGRTAYIDDTGNFGFDFSSPGTSSHFILCAVVVENTKMEELHQKVQMVKKGNGFEKTEMKSSVLGNNYNRRNRLIQDLMPIDFRITLLIADKHAFMEGSPLREYPDPFKKYLHQRLYTLLYSAYPKLQIIEDEHGTTEFQNSFKKYVENHRPQQNFLNEYGFDFCDSKDELLVQLADIVGGTISKHFSDPSSPNYLEILRGKIMSIEEFPQRQDPYWGTMNPEHHKYSKDIFTLALKCAEDFIQLHEKDESIEIRLQVAFLRYLVFQVLNVNPTHYLYATHILPILRDLVPNPKQISRDYLYRRVIAPLRDKGVILASSSHGYKLPISINDITTYINQTHTVISPMLSRMEKCRNLIRRATNNDLDILDDPAFRRYKNYFG